jgi:hypothetical protein
VLFCSRGMHFNIVVHLQREPHRKEEWRVKRSEHVMQRGQVHLSFQVSISIMEASAVRLCRRVPPPSQA